MRCVTAFLLLLCCLEHSMDSFGWCLLDCRDGVCRMNYLLGAHHHRVHDQELLVVGAIATMRIINLLLNLVCRGGRTTPIELRVVTIIKSLFLTHPVLLVTLFLNFVAGTIIEINRFILTDGFPALFRINLPIPLVWAPIHPVVVQILIILHVAVYFLSFRHLPIILPHLLHNIPF